MLVEIRFDVTGNETSTIVLEVFSGHFGPLVKEEGYAGTYISSSRMIRLQVPPTSGTRCYLDLEATYPGEIRHVAGIITKAGWADIQIRGKDGSWLTHRDFIGEPMEVTVEKLAKANADEIKRLEDRARDLSEEVKRLEGCVSSNEEDVKRMEEILNRLKTVIASKWMPAKTKKKLLTIAEARG